MWTVDLAAKDYERFFGMLAQYAEGMIRHALTGDLPDKETWAEVHRLMGGYNDYIAARVPQFRRWQLVCDATTNPPAMRARGKLAFRIIVGFGTNEWNEQVFSKLVEI